mmetsp:Transcript_17563/g.52740  ORF Transcript_17563/g.52740 Transcript_17563/m.52740 type:complete len:844 (-) Transcript_17563:602-3133(-)
MPLPAKKSKTKHLKSRLGVVDKGQQRLSTLQFKPLALAPQSPVLPPQAPRLQAQELQRAIVAKERPHEEWTKQYSPAFAEHLAVAKKKVQELRTWLEQQELGLQRQYRSSRVLLLTGPPGSGKTTALKVLATELGFEICEWQPPAALSWEECEHSRQGMLPLGYTSKLAEFADFASRAKMPLLPLISTAQRTRVGRASSQHGANNTGSGSTSTAGSNQSGAFGTSNNSASGSQTRRGKLGVVEDLPHAASAERREQLAASLRELAAAGTMPVVLMATESSGSGKAEDHTSASGGCFGLHKDLLAALEGCGVERMRFNPITTAAAAKCLTAIAAAECRELPALEAKQLAADSAGDLRNAISMLQLLLCGTVPVDALKSKKGAAAKRKRGKAAGTEAPPRSTAFTGRDAGLTLFHALGKLLYNKRVEDGPEGAASQGPATSSQPAASGSGALSQPVSQAPSDDQVTAPLPASQPTAARLAAQPAAAANTAGVATTAWQFQLSAEAAAQLSQVQKTTAAVPSLDPLTQGTGIFSQESSDDDCGDAVAMVSVPVDQLGGNGSAKQPHSQPPGTRPGVASAPAEQELQAVNQANGILDLTEDGNDSALFGFANCLLPKADITAPDILPRYRRRPLQCRPEEVLLQAGLEAPSVAAFLHENLPDFLAGDGIDSAAAVYSYLTTSDQLSAFRRSDYASEVALVDDYAVSSIADSCAALVASRGVLFGNASQAPRRFQSMRAPVMFQVQRGMTANAESLQEVTGLMSLSATYSGLGGGTAAAQVMPFVRALSAADQSSPAASLAPRCWHSLRDNRLVSTAATSVPQLTTLSLADGAEESHGDDAVYDEIES